MPSPRVGVAVTVLRRAPSGAKSTSGSGSRAAWEVLLVERGKEPHKGRWAFPGGSVEYGEGYADAAAREMGEEVPDVRIRWAATPAFFVTDAMARDAHGAISAHFLLVHCLGFAPAGDNVTERASSDAADAAWLPVDALDRLGDKLLPGVAPVLQRALRCAAAAGGEAYE